MEPSHVTKNKEGGFTLVELAIVMIIIGLLIGGILKGQELVANAQTTATIAQIKGLDAAVATFRDKYSALPGDMPNSANRLRDCNGTCATGAAGGFLGNGRIDIPVGLGSLPAANDEGRVAFSHMAAADLISGLNIDGQAVFGDGLPQAKMGGGFWIGFTADGAGSGVINMRPGHYLVFNGLVGDVTPAGFNGITASQAGQVDRKLDDGEGDTGDVQSTGSQCLDGNGDYQEAVTAASCSMYIRVQG